MPIDHLCPACDQPLQVPEDYLGRRIACPACKHIFLIEKPSRGRDDRGRNDRWRDDDRDRDFEREDHQYWEKKASHSYTLGFLSCVLCWIPIVGIILGIIAWTTAAHDLALFRDERYPPPGMKARLEQGRTLGIIGICLSALLVLSCCGLGIGTAIFDDF